MSKDLVSLKTKENIYKKKYVDWPKYKYVVSGNENDSDPTIAGNEGQNLHYAIL